MYQLLPDKKKSVPDSKAIQHKDVPDVPDVPLEMRKLFNFLFWQKKRVSLQHAFYKSRNK